MSKELKKLMAKHKLTQRSVAAMFLVSQPAVHNWLTGKRQVPVKVLLRLQSLPKQKRTKLLPFVPDRRLTGNINEFDVLFYFYGQDPVTGLWYDLDTGKQVFGKQQLTNAHVEAYKAAHAAQDVPCQ